jgi:hypothetical protein
MWLIMCKRGCYTSCCWRAASPDMPILGSRQTQIKQRPFKRDAQPYGHILSCACLAAKTHTQYVHLSPFDCPILSVAFPIHSRSHNLHCQFWVEH